MKSEVEEQPKTKKKISVATVEEALVVAARGASLVVGPYPGLALPDDYARRRSLFHGLRDDERRAVLLALLLSEGDRLHRDAECSFTPKPRGRQRAMIGDAGGDVAGDRQVQAHVVEEHPEFRFGRGAV